MFNQIFIPFLVQEGLINDKQGAELAEAQRHARIRLGTLAVEEKMMSSEDAEHVNRLQAAKNARFGDIAIERGYLTKEQVESLLSKQPREHIVLKQLVLDKGYISSDKFDLALGTFKTSLGVSYDDFEQLQDKNPEAFMDIIADIDRNDTVLWEYIKMFINTTVRFIDRDIRLSKVYRTDKAEFKHVVWQKGVGADGDYDFVLASNDTKAACAFSSAYGKIPIETMDEDGQDSFKEFLNCVGGLVTADMENRGIKELTIEVPEYRDCYAIGQKVYIVPLSLPMGDFFLTVIDQRTITAKDKKRFVLVDDSKIARHLLKSILEEAGHEVIAEASNGLDGFDKYRQLSPDVITLDVTMPILNGIECLKKILDTNPDAQVIMVTSVGKESLIEEARALGAKAVIVKPIEKKDVLAEIEKLK